MTGHVHAAIGAASTLALGAILPAVRPTDTPALIEAIAFAAAGALIPDIDISGTGKVKKTATTAVSLAFLAGAWVYRSGRTDILGYFAPKTIIGAILFLACLTLGLFSKHRTFTHSILGLVLFTVSIYLLFTPPDALYFGLSMLLHQLFDMLNMTKVRWLWPMKGGVAAGFCKSDGFIAEGIGLTATLLTGVLLYIYYTKGLV